MSNKKKITEILKEKCESDKKFIDACYNDKIKKNIQERYRKDFPIEKLKKLIDEKCIIELNKENSFRCNIHLNGNPFALLFCLYMLEDAIKKEYTIPEPLADIIKLIKNDDYNQEVHDISED